MTCRRVLPLCPLVFALLAAFNVRLDAQAAAAPLPAADAPFHAPPALHLPPLQTHAASAAAPAGSPIVLQHLTAKIATIVIDPSDARPCFAMRSYAFTKQESDAVAPHLSTVTTCTPRPRILRRQATLQVPALAPM